uniref:Rad50/SbcC-type AAA domain-containing protein n=1 Tax=Rhodopseudomonas palustris (strain BisA53) TaxID=316055 RepID=Q07NV0_RHOP5
MTEARSILLTRLSFTGGGKPIASIDFGAGLNLLYGGSNAGKSFVLKAVDYVTGSSEEFPGIKESQGYENVFLSFRLLPEGRSITIRRSIRGGGIDWYDGVESESRIDGVVVEHLHQTHGKGRKGAGSLSERLLLHLGISGAKIASNKSGTPESFTFRNFMPYVLVNEGRMLGDDSPIKQNSRSKEGTDKNSFRFLLSGHDDASIVRTRTPTEARAAKSGKIELLESMLADAESKVERLTSSQEFSEDDEDKLQALGQSIGDQQTKLDRLREQRRTTMNDIEAVRAEASELETALVRYSDLEAIFQSDIRRLQAIEEGGFLLRRFDDQPCPLCGAEPGDQHAPHAAEDLERQHQAAVTEIEKISRDVRELRELIVSLTARLDGLRAREQRFLKAVRDTEGDIVKVAPQESSLRHDYLALMSRAESWRLREIAIDQRDVLQIQLAKVRKARATVKRDDEVPMGIASNIGHELSMIVASILQKWEYPGIEAVRWDPAADDIEVNGWPRKRNGKGVKAIFQSALKVAILMYCREKELPHPGFIFLDSPLVTYRKPIMNERHGELSDDERVIRETSLDRKFYEHLASLSNMGQFIIVENADPPPGIEKLGRVEVFAGENGVGRQGLFPPVGAN